MTLSRLARLGLLVACLAVCSLEAQETPTGKETSYYPLKVNTTWTYKTNDNKKMVFKVVRQEKVGGTVCGVIESSVDGKVLATDTIGVTAEGVCRFKIGDNVATPPLCLLKSPVGTATTWKAECKIKDETLKGTFKVTKEDVKVPFGTFPQAVVARADDLDVNGIKVGVTYFFVKDVGIVKQILTLPTGSIVLELEAFELGK